MSDPRAKAALFDWLRCAELSDEDLSLLQVTTSVDSEARAFDVLLALASLTTRPMVLCFDQLEATNGLLGNEGAVALSNALMEIYERAPVCLVLMCQSQYWGNYVHLIPQAALERIRELPPLVKPTGGEAVALLEARLGWLWASSGLKPPYSTYPFPAEVVRRHTESQRPTIRGLLAYFGRQLDEMRAQGKIVELGKERKRGAPASQQPRAQARSPREALDAALVEKVNSIPGGSLGAPAGREEYLRKAIVRVLVGLRENGRSLGGHALRAVVDPPTPRSGPRPPAVVTIGRQRLALDVDSGDPRNLWRVLGRLGDKVARSEADAGLLLREESVPLSQHATKTKALVRSLEKQGGGLAYLDEALAHRLVASELLLDAVSASEVWADDRAVDAGEATTFLLEHAGLCEGLAPILSRVLERPPMAVSRTPSEAAERTPAATLEERVVAELRASGPIVRVGALASTLGDDRDAVERLVGRLAQEGVLRLGKDRDGEPTVAFAGGRP